MFKSATNSKLQSALQSTLNSALKSVLKSALKSALRGHGVGGVPWVQIMEIEFECLVVRGGDGGHFAEKFVKKYCS